MSNLTRYDPLDDFFRGFFVRPVEFGATAETRQPGIKLDIRSQDNGYLLQAELPGVKKEDIHVDINGSVVAISTENKQTAELKEGERVLRSERYVGKLSRSIDLGVELDESSAEARYSDGVLTLRLPKRIAVSSKRLQIQ